MAENIPYYPKVQKLWNNKFNIQQQNKAIFTSLQMKQAKEIVEPHYTCLHQNNQRFLYLEKL